MSLHSLAGRPVSDELLIDPSALVRAYHDTRPDPSVPAQRITFGTSGHRGTALDGSFNEDHIRAVTHAICAWRRENGITGPLFVGFDTHALSGPAFRTVLEAGAALGMEIRYQEGETPTPTPVISNAILNHNRSYPKAPADGVIITPSHNPPGDGGIKYNPPSGGPAGSEVTVWIEERANRLLENGASRLDRIPFAKALKADSVHAIDFVMPYVKGLYRVVDMDAIASSGLRLGADPLGGSGAGYWPVIAERYGLDIDVVNSRMDPTFSFMRVDGDGVIRMDCSSPYAMAGLVNLKDRYDLAFGNDPDFDRHGIVTPTVGLMNPNHVLAVAVDYLFGQRSGWPSTCAIGKTLVSSSMIDRIAVALGREIVEVPVGFKWFVDGLLTGGLGFGGEESAGASFLAMDGSPWSTDKDGIIMNLLAAEVLAVTGEDPARRYDRLAEEHGRPVYARSQAPASRERKRALKAMAAEDVKVDALGGDPITRILTRAPGNDAPIGGLKVETASGWFAARPSGTEDIYKIYAESFRGEDHLRRIQEEAQALVDGVLEAAGV